MHYAQAHALSHQALQNLAPSIFAEAPFHTMSAKYAFIPTIEVLDELAKADFVPVSAVQSRTRIEGKENFTKHQIRLRHRRDLDDPLFGAEVGSVFREVILTNSHDGASAYRLEGGLYRKVCSNGLCLPEGGAYGAISVRHSGKIGGEVIDGCIKVLDQATDFAEKAHAWAELGMGEGESILFAEAAGALRWGRSDDGNSLAPVTPNVLLRPRRWDDEKSNLWTVYNRVQENLVKGGQSGRSSGGRRVRTREVTGIDQNTRLNRELSSLAARFAELKTAN